MRFYHVTKTENVDSILMHGLIPQIGENSKSVNEKDDVVYLCDKDSIPYWKILLDANVLIAVELEEEPESYDYREYKEYFHYGPIAASSIQLIDEFIDIHDSMKQLCVQHLHCMSAYATKCVRYYNRAIGTDLEKEMYDDIAHYGHVLSVCLPKLDYSMVDISSLREELTSSGEDGNYTICDTYYNTGKRLWEQLIEYGDDDLYSNRKFIHDYIKTHLQGCLDVDTGGWCD